LLKTTFRHPIHADHCHLSHQALATEIGSTLLNVLAFSPWPSLTAMADGRRRFSIGRLIIGGR
jgi:hypothetical protein